MLTAEAARERVQDVRRDVERILDHSSRLNETVSSLHWAKHEDAEQRLAKAESLGRALSDQALELFKKVIMLHDHLMPDRQTPLL